MTNQITNIAGYQFIEIDDIESAHKQVQGVCNQIHLKGTIFISPEGINLSLAGNQADIEFALDQLSSVCGFKQLLFNTTYSEEIPFRRLLVKTRSELVSTRPKISDLVPTNEKHGQTLSDHKPGNSNYISSDKLKQWLDDDKEFTLLDLRNAFEYELGSFDQAKHLKLKHFRELEGSSQEFKDIPKDKPVVTFCTGGIRCEKGAPFIVQHGFGHVYQLKGGILDYLKKFSDRHWHGDCFVFDERISLNHELSPNYVQLCLSCQTSLKQNEERFCTACAGLT